VEQDLRTKFNGFILRTKIIFGTVLKCLQTEARQKGKFNLKHKSCTAVCSVTEETVKRNKTASGLI